MVNFLPTAVDSFPLTTGVEVVIVVTLSYRLEAPPRTRSQQFPDSCSITLKTWEAKAVSSDLNPVISWTWRSNAFLPGLHSQLCSQLGGCPFCALVKKEHLTCQTGLIF